MAAKVEKGFEALKVNDYFQAKKIFSEVLSKKTDVYASYGLALIFSRQDNPFSNGDSACKYIHLSFNLFLQNKKALSFFDFQVDSISIMNLADSITLKNYRSTKKQNSSGACNYFLRSNYLAKTKYIQEIVEQRDDLEFDHIIALHNSDSTTYFILTHPLSAFYNEAFMLKDRQIYDEQTQGEQAEKYIAFIKNYPKNVMVNIAYEKLFDVYRQSADVKGLAGFVQNFPNAPQNLEAWKLLFSLSAKEFSYYELKAFVDVYPNFPLKNSILIELELNKVILYPYQQGDFSGFIDDKLKIAIKPMYDEASDFHEGLAVVSKNDSVFFINKQNVNAFNEFYTDAYVFRNNIAPVKTANSWFFINRQGQIISKAFDEINELCNGIYVVKVGDKYGALDHFAQRVIEPKFSKLGDFKNDFAYYIENGLYGFVSRSGNVHKAEFDWISDFDELQIAIIKQNNKYGLINNAGKIILDCHYDQIIKTEGTDYALVINNSYGFYTIKGCFISGLSFDYSKEQNPIFYSKDKLYKLVKKGEQGIVDANGRWLINFGNYQDIGFANYGLIRVKQKNKYAYLDQKLNLIIPYKYMEAGDFMDSIAICKIKESYLLVNLQGKEVFSTSFPILKISKHYYFVNDEVRSIIDNKGEVIFSDVDNYQKLGSNKLIVTLNSGEIKLLSD